MALLEDLIATGRYKDAFERIIGLLEISSEQAPELKDFFVFTLTTYWQVLAQFSLKLFF